MSSELSDKIVLIREKMGLKRAAFSRLLDIPYGTLKKYESGDYEMGFSNLSKIAKHPETNRYILWLITGETAPEIGQYSPLDNAPLSGSSEAVSSPGKDEFVSTCSRTLVGIATLGWIDIRKDVEIDEISELLYRENFGRIEEITETDIQKAE